MENNTQLCTTESIENVKSKILKAYNSTYDEYNRIFINCKYLPTKINDSIEINGFTERNLTYNFCHSYSNLNKENNPIVWQEVPIKKCDKKHIDSIIIDNCDVFFIESKRLYGIEYLEKLLNDFNRIAMHKDDRGNVINLKDYFPLPIVNKNSNKYIVLLADQYYRLTNKKNQYWLDKENCFDVFFKTGVIPSQDDRYKKAHDYYKKTSDYEFIHIDANRSIIIEPNNIMCNIQLKKPICYTLYCGIWKLPNC